MSNEPQTINDDLSGLDGQLPTDLIAALMEHSPRIVIPHNRAVLVKWPTSPTGWMIIDTETQ